jgi:hypothetical protein
MSVFLEILFKRNHIQKDKQNSLIKVINMELKTYILLIYLKDILMKNYKSQ